MADTDDAPGPEQPKRKRGRPALGDKARDRRIQVRLSPADEALIKGMLKPGETVSAWGEKILRAAARRRLTRGGGDES